MQEENKKQPKSEKNREEHVENAGIAALKKIGLKEVSNKTFINLENLTALLDKDFSKLNKTKALGFIQILQREFDVDLHTLKNEYLHFNNSEKAVEKPKAAAKSAVYADEEPTKWLPYLLLVLAALVGGYFLFMSDGKSESVASMDMNVVKNAVVVEKAKESLLTLDKTYEEETNDSDEVDLNKVVEAMFKQVDDNDTSTVVENNASNVITIESNQTAEEESISLEDDGSTLEAIEEVEVSPVPIVPTEEAKKEKVKKTVRKEIKNKTRAGLFIDPIQKAWVGIIFLDNMRKKDYLIRNILRLDSKRDQLILIGHKNFKIYNKQHELGFNSKRKVRFLYQDGELRELSKGEYNDYKGGVTW